MGNGGKTINRTAPGVGSGVHQKVEIHRVRRVSGRVTAPGGRGTGKDPVEIQFPATKRSDASGADRGDFVSVRFRGGRRRNSQTNSAVFFPLTRVNPTRQQRYFDFFAGQAFFLVFFF